jgi:ABC-type oligopeptide transport system ATPase subunit
MSIVDVRGLVKTYARRTVLWAPPVITTAVNRVSFTVDAGEVFGLVGESGSGKTTLGRCLLRLVEPTRGEFLFKGESVFAASTARMRELRREMQMVFQDPVNALNPRMRVGAIVEEGLVIQGKGTPNARQARVIELFEMVGLDPAWRNRLPEEFSGGQRQRIGIARALALQPSLLVADEPVSALDVSVQAQILNLLRDLQERLALTVILVAHDLGLVRYLCQRVGVMYQGRLVEVGPAAELFTQPAHEYTRALLSARPSVDRGQPERVIFDPESFDPERELREIAPGHWAA